MSPAAKKAPTKVRTKKTTSKAQPSITAEQKTRTRRLASTVVSDDVLEAHEFSKQVSGELLNEIIATPTDNMVAKSVLLSIAWNTKNDWYCYASSDLIARYAFCSPKDLDNTIKSLESAGIISIEGAPTERRYSIDIRKVKLISRPIRNHQISQHNEVLESLDPDNLPRLPGYYPIINIATWSAKLQTAQKLVIRFLVDSARDGWANVLFSELCYVTGLTAEEADSILRQLVDLGIIIPPSSKVALTETPREYDWQQEPVTRCLIKPSGLVRLIPTNPSP